MLLLAALSVTWLDEGWHTFMLRSDFMQIRWSLSGLIHPNGTSLRAIFFQMKPQSFK